MPAIEVCELANIGLQFFIHIFPMPTATVIYCVDILQVSMSICSSVMVFRYIMLYMHYILESTDFYFEGYILVVPLSFSCWDSLN